MSKSKRKSVDPKEAPSPWGWAWQKVPGWLRPVVLLVVLALLITAFVTGIVTDLVQLLQKGEGLREAPIAEWYQPRAMHLWRDYDTFSSFVEGAYVLDTKDVEVLASSTADTRLDKLDELGVPIAPVALAFDVGVERRSATDEMFITVLELHVNSFEPMTGSQAIVLYSGPAADYLPVNKLGSLLIDPSASTYDALRPRSTASAVGKVRIVDTYDALRLDVNGLKPGLYKLGLDVVYVLNGKKYSAPTLSFSMAVPDTQTLQAAYFSEWGQNWMGPEDPRPVISEYLAKEAQYVDLEVVGRGETATLSQEPYVYIVNLGADIDLTGWTLGSENAKIYYTFPPRKLKAGTGIQVHRGLGTNSDLALYGAQDVFADIQESGSFLYLQDPSGTVMAGAWIAPDSR